MKRLLHTGLTLLLTAAVLGGSLLPPAVCHAHAEGNQTHSHSPAVTEHRQSEHHDHSSGDRHAHHSHGHKQPGHQQQARTDVRRRESTTRSPVERTRAVTAHLHLSLIGIAASLFVPLENDSDVPSTPSSDPLFHVVSILNDVIPVPRVALPIGDDATARTPQGLDVSVDAISSTVAMLCVRVGERVLLCDGARRQRSGVLLI